MAAGGLYPGEQMDTPAPGDHDIGGAIGSKQIVSTKPTLPSFSMGARRYVGGPQHYESSRASPGPAAYELPTFGKKQVDRRQPPAFKIGEKLYHGSPQHDMDHHTPGAGEYEIPGSMGKQPLKRSNPSYTLGVRRYHGGTVDAVDQGTPGPNAYRNIPTAVDRQVDSTRPSSPRFSIGARLWHNSPQEFLERGTPGPGAYEQPGIGRKLPDSRQRTPSSFTMGARLYKGSPEEALSHDSPGPQAYAYVGAMGKQVVSTKTTYGGARWSQSPRFGLSPRRAKQMEERLRGIGKGPVGSPRLPPTHSGSSPRRPSAGPRPGTSGSPRRSPRRTPRAATAEPGSRGRPGGGGPAGKRKPKNTTATGGTYGQPEKKRPGRAAIDPATGTVVTRS